MRIALAVLLLSAVASADSITTKDGATHEGKVVRELERGYLFRGESGVTMVVPFDQIDDVNISPSAVVPLQQPATEAPRVNFALQGLLEQREVLLSNIDSVSLAWPIVFMCFGAALISSSPLLLNSTLSALGMFATGGWFLGFGGTLLGVRLWQRAQRRGEIEGLDRRIAVWR